jgi:MFS family permease
MWEIVLVLFVLQRYRSPALAGVTVLFSVVPGLFLGPVVGALLDRQGRVRLMIVDYGTTAILACAIALLSFAHSLPVPLLLGIVTVLSVTNLLSVSGASSLFPLMVPRALWDRVNGFNISTYGLAGILGPALGGLLVAQFQPEAAL